MPGSIHARHCLYDAGERSFTVSRHVDPAPLHLQIPVLRRRLVLHCKDQPIGIEWCCT